MITVNRAGAGRTRPIEWFYKYKHYGRKSSSIRSRIRGMISEMGVAERIGLNVMTTDTVTYSGKKLVLELTLEDGSTLKATPDHEIYTFDEGFKALSTVGIRDRVICDRVPPKEPKKNYRQVQGLLFHPFAGGAGSYTPRGNHIEGRLYRVPYHRLVVEADINNMTLEKLVYICRNEMETAACLTFLDPEIFAVHHKDEDWKNNVRRNLEILTHSEHAELHAPDKVRHFAAPVPVKVLQVRRWGVTDTYDAHCENEHNFIANGMVVHNSGKTSLAVAYARLLGVKAVYLVATKALEAQVLADFSSMGMVNVHGRANYTCPNYGDCDKGADQSCSLAQTESCPYSRQVNEAAEADLVVTNYAYYLWSKGVRNKAFTDTGLLICDEAHALEHQLGSFASVKLYARELAKLKCPYHPKTEMSDVMKNEADAWKLWAAEAAKPLELKGDRRDEDEADLLDRLRKVVRMHSNWVWQFDDRGHVGFEPVRLSAYTRGLFSNVPRVFMMSASLSEFAMKLLMPSDTRYDYRAWPPVFPQQNSPVYHIPTVKLSWKSTDEDFALVVSTMDKIIEGRLDRKGIVHTVSYGRAKKALAASRYRHLFEWNDDSAGLYAALDRFRRSEGRTGRILVTPSVEEGFDFPDDYCEYQIVLKFPFPNETQRVVKERCAQIAGYRLHHAAQKIVQMRGRAVRSESDRAEMFILDNAVKQLCGPEGRSYCPPGFRIFTVNEVPPAPPKIA
jgi:hypothetical protein